jgi:ABC-type transporter Mla subunit MlaD
VAESFDPAGTSSPEFERSVARAANRIEAIIDAAENTAAEIRAAARIDADRYLDDAAREADRLTLTRIGLLSELTESLTERVDSLKRESDEVIRALEDAMRALAATVGSSAPGTAGASRAGESPSRPERAGRQEPGSPWRSEG